MYKNSTNFANDKMLSQFFILCKNKKFDIEGWISQNELVVNNLTVSVCSPRFSGYTLLHLAVEAESDNAVAVLLRLGADITLKNTKGQSPLHLGMVLVKENVCTEHKMNSILDMILMRHKNNYVNPVDNMGLSHFHIACYRSKDCIVTEFLKSGVELNNFIKFDSLLWSGYTPLHVAAKYSLFPIVYLLLEHGADVNSKNAAGLTPLHFAIKKGDILLAKLLFTAVSGNCFNPTDQVGLSELHAICKDHKGMSSIDIRVLLNNVNINVTVGLNSPLWPGYTALHIAIYEKNIYMITILLQNGANINTKDLNGLTALQLAIHKHLINDDLMNLILTEYNKSTSRSAVDTELYKFFSACMSTKTDLTLYYLTNSVINIDTIVPQNYILDLPGYTPLHFAVENGDAQIIEVLLKKGASIYIQDINGLSPLHLAVRRKSYWIITSILRYRNEITSNPIDNEGLSHFHIACMTDKPQIIQKFLQLGVMVNITTKSDKTPLHYAVEFACENTVELLLENNADFTAQDSHGFTPLHVAIENKNETMANMILSYHSKIIVNPINNFGLSHMHIACMKNNASLVDTFFRKSIVLSNASVNFNSIHYAGFTPLHFAVKYNCVETVKVLLSHRVDIAAKDALKKVPLHYALTLRSSDLNQMLSLFWSAIQEGSVQLDGTGLSTLQFSCIRNDVRMVENIVKRKGLIINDCITLKSALWSDFTSLHFAVAYGSIEIVDLLLQNCTEVNISDKNGFTPLHLACSLSKQEIIKSLLKSGCDSAAKTINGLTPLRLAMQTKNQSIVQDILSHPLAMSANPMDNEGFTYFHIACLKNIPDIVRKFITTGVDVDEPVHFFARKHSGLSPLHIAVESRNKEIVDLLLTSGVTVNLTDCQGCTPLHLTGGPRHISPDLAVRLLKHGAVPDARNALGETLVELAIKRNQVEILEIALQHGANPNKANPVLGEQRPLELAITQCKKEMFNILLKYGADATVKFRDRRTFVHRILSNNVQFSENYYFHIFLGLLEHGCDLDSLNDTGRSALQMAYWPFNFSALQALLRCGANVDVEDLSGRSIVSYFLEITTSRMPRSELYQLFVGHLLTRRLFGPLLSLNNEVMLRILLEDRKEYLGEELQPWEKNFENRCRRELDRMNELRFGYSSLHDLFRNVNKMARHVAQNGALAEFLRSDEFKEMFPLCGCIIMMRYGNAIKKRNLCQPAEEAIDRLMLHGFTELRWNRQCSEALVNYLGEKELRNLAAA